MALDDQTLEALTSALAASPGNAQLLSVVLSALLERDEAERAVKMLGDVDLSTLSGTPAEIPAARALIEAARLDDALGLLTSQSAEAGVLRAQAQLEKGDVDAARATYRAAVTQSAAVQDAQLEAQLGSTRQASAGRGGSILRLVTTEEDPAELSDILHPPQEVVNFDDVGGLEDVKKQIHRRVILPMQKPSLFQRFKRRAGGGILLYGPPGCGKTLLARATAGQMGAGFFNVGISDVLDMYIGESEQKLHALFERAREKKPSVLFFDEIEALGGKRRSHGDQSSSKLVSQFLSELDGFDRANDGILVLGATNLPWAVDPAFRRPGRFDRVLFVPPPDKGARLRILEILLEGRPTAPDVDLAFLVKHTPGFSGADLQNIVETAVDEAIDASLQSGADEPISQAHLNQALKEVKPTTQEWLTTARNYARYANDGGQYDDVLKFLKAHGR